MVGHMYGSRIWPHATPMGKAKNGCWAGISNLFNPVGQIKGPDKGCWPDEKNNNKKSILIYFIQYYIDLIHPDK